MHLILCVLHIISDDRKVNDFLDDCLYVCISSTIGSLT